MASPLHQRPLVVAELTTDLSIAVAEGSGSGRFLTLALLDALGSDATLSGIRCQPLARGAATSSIDFAFFHEFSAQGEVIRAGLDPAGQVVSAELLRSAQEHARRYRRAADLAAALRDGHALQAIHLASPPSGDPTSLRLRLETGRSFVIDLGEFDRIAGVS